MGRQYYIDTAGSDQNDGLTPDAAFAGFSPLCSVTLQAGDQVLLRRGCCWNEMLELRGGGSPGAPAEIGAYGEGAAPCIRRSGDISERCVRLINATHLTLSDLEVCNAGAGIVLFYDHSYHNENVTIQRVFAHDFFGIYRASGESSRNPAWKSYRSDDRVGFSMGICVTGNDSTPMNDERVLTGLTVSECEISQTGGGLGLDWCDHRNCDDTITGFNKFGDVVFERLNLHDNDVPDVSLTSLFLQCVTGAVFRDSVIDNGAGGAPWGTAAVHLQLARNILIENVTIRNMPHTNVSDECGIDFETDVEDCIIRGCTFENNAGAAIQFLSNFDISPIAVSRNVIIENCRFLNNNWAKLYTDPSQVLVQIWQHDNCPSGAIRRCTYTNPEGVSLFGGDGGLHLFHLENNTAVS